MTQILQKKAMRQILVHDGNGYLLLAYPSGFLPIRVKVR
jgi:hypothetical protein